MAQGTLTLTRDELAKVVDAAVAEALAKATAPAETPAPTRPTRPIDLTDPRKVAKSPEAREVATYFVAKDPMAPASFPQRTRLIGLAKGTKGLQPKSFGAITTGQAAVASFHLGEGRAVRFGDLILRP